MEFATSLPEQNNLLGDVDEKEIVRASLLKSTSMVIDNKEKESDEEEEEEDVPIKPFGKLKSSIENIKNLQSDTLEKMTYTTEENIAPKEEDNSKMILEYEKVLKSYLPFHLQNYLENLVEEEADNMKTINIETFCVIAAIDISEIVDFINQLQSKGKSGSTYLKEEINKYFCEIIDFVVEKKGDILNVTEKTLLTCWTINENETDSMDECSMADLTLEALKACLKLIEEHGKRSFEFEDFKLDYVMKIGVGAGMNTVLYIEVEKEHLWQYINEGSIITQANSVLNYNTPGNLGISHQTLKWIGIVIDIPSLNLGAYDKKCIVIDNLDNVIRKVAEASDDEEDENDDEEELSIENKIERFARFVNDDLVYRFQACFYEISKYHEELKLTTMIIKIDEITFETNDDLEVLQKLMSLLMKTLTKYEGVLNNFYYDDKYFVFECIFGAPPFVHENDALYAIEAAIEVAGFLRRLLNCYYISITTGILWYTGLGNNNFGRFFLHGESIDYCYKIFTSPRSKYSILCDENTCLLTENYINFIDIGVLKFQKKDSTKSEKLFVVINQKKKMSFVPSNNDFQNEDYDKNDINLVGKNYQWKLCVSLLKKFIHSNKRRALIIQGEEGYGISPFIRNFEKKAMEEGCSVCIGKISDESNLTPFALYESLLREVIKVTVNEKRKQEHQRHKKNLESLIEEEEEDEANNSKSGISLQGSEKAPSVRQPKINNFKLIGKKSSMKRSHGPRSALRNGKMKRSTSSTVSFDNSVITNSEVETETEVESLMKGEKMKIRKRSSIFDDQESIITNNTNIKNYNGSSFEEDILEALFYLDEREEIAPLLNIIYYNRFEDTNEVKMINKRMVFFELCNLVCRLLTKLSFITPLVIILDNAHLQDYFSWKLTSMIFKRCTRLFLCICTRPQSYYTSPEINYITKDIWTSLQTTLVTLNNFSETDTQKYLTLYYNELKKLKYVKNKCAKVNNELVFNLWKLTEGNPLFILRIANSLYADEENVFLNDDSNLVLKKPFPEMELSQHCGSMKDLLQYQISTLDPDFKNFLFICSLINKKWFSFESINDFVIKYKSNNKICESVYNFINTDTLKYNTLDKYNYLRKFYKFKKTERSADIDQAESKASSVTNISINSNYRSLGGNDELPIGLDQNNYDVIFSFSGELIKNVIYEDKSVDDRLTLHELYAQYIEEKRKEEYFILFYHYCNSSNTDKMIFYLTKLCHIMYKMGASHLAIESYEFLLSLYGESIDNTDGGNENIIKKSDVLLKSQKTIKDPDAKISIKNKPSNYQLACMFYEVGSCYYGLSKFRNAELYFLKTLDYLEYKFPEKNVSLVVKLIKETKKRDQFKKLSEKDRYDLKKEEIERIEKLISEIKDESERERVRTKYKKSLEKGSLSLCQKSLYMLHEVYNIYHKSIHSQIALLMALNDPSSSETGLHLAEIIAKYGLELVWVFSTNATGWSYLNAAEEIINPDDNDIPIMKMTRSHLIVYDCLAIAHIFLKSWSKGKHYVDIIIKLSQKTGDTEIWGRATILKSVLYFQAGAIDKSFRLAKEVFNNSSERNIWRSQCTSLLITLQYLGVKEASDIIYTPLNVMKIIFNLPSKFTSSNNEDVVLYAGLILDVCFRFKVPVPDIFDYVKKVIPSLEKLEPSCYYSVFAFPQYVIVLFLFYELGYFKKQNEHYDLCIQLLNTTLQAMDLYKETQIVQPLISMLKGLTFLIQNNINNAMVSWENGANKAKRSQFFGAMLYWKMSYYGKGEIAERSSAIVKKLLEKINASFDLEIIQEWTAEPLKVTKARKG